MGTCTVHPGGPCRGHDHGAPCPECGARTGQPCSLANSRHQPFCCGGCYHEQEEN